MGNGKKVFGVGLLIVVAALSMGACGSSDAKTLYKWSCNYERACAATADEAAVIVDCLQQAPVRPNRRLLPLSGWRELMRYCGGLSAQRD